MAKVTFGKGRKGGGRLSVAQLKIQEGASKAIDGAESKVERFTRLLGNITRKNDMANFLYCHNNYLCFFVINI